MGRLRGVASALLWALACAAAGASALAWWTHSVWLRVGDTYYGHWYVGVAGMLLAVVAAVISLALMPRKEAAPVVE